MRNRDKTQQVKVKRGVGVLHIETDMAIVNIYLGLMDCARHEIETIEVISDRYAGERWVTVERRGGPDRGRYARLRLMRETKEECEARVEAAVTREETRIEEGQRRWSETGSTRR